MFLINPLRQCLPCCFSMTQSDKAIIEISEILDDIHALNEISNPKNIKLQKDYKKQELEKAYRLAIENFPCFNQAAPDKMLALYLGEVMFNYGRLCYEENFNLSKEIQLAALSMQLYAYGILDRCIALKDFDTLEDMKMQAAVRGSLFPEMEQKILDLDLSHCLDKVGKTRFAPAFAKERDFALATTLRWLGHCYQNIDKYLESNPLNDRRYEQLYYFSESILKNHLDDQACLMELSELYYNSWSFLHERKHPGDWKGKCATYDRVLEINKDHEMRARVANMRFGILDSHGQHDEAVKYLQEAMEIRAALPETKQNGFLLGNLRNNYVYHLLRQPEPDLEKADKMIRLALCYSSESRANGEDHMYFAIWDMKLAQIYLLKGNKTEALQMIEKAIGTLSKYPESNASLLSQALGLKGQAQN